MQKKNKMGLWTLTSLVTGNMIGSGVFMLPSDLARIGTISLLAWVFTACGALTLAIVFSKMSSLVPKTGGPYIYAQVAFGDFIGFQTAYNYWIALWIGNAAIAVALIGYLCVFFPSLVNPVFGTTLSIAIVWLLTIINIKGVRPASILQLITTILKFLTLLLIAIFGWWYFNPSFITKFFNLTNQSNFSAFSTAATLTMWTFIGVESASIPAGFVTNPRRNIPLATIFGTLIAAGIYITSSTALMGMLPPEVLAASTSPFAAAASLILGKWGELFIAAGAVISCFGALNGWILLQGQVPLAAAHDRLMPKFFAKQNKNKIPVGGLVISSFLISILLLLTAKLNLIEQFRLLILIAAVTQLLAYFYTAVAEIIILPQKEKLTFGNTMQLIVAGLAICYSFWAIFGSGKNIIFYVAMIFFSSVPLYTWIHYKKRLKR
jgi:basic amino acid/polyamine antiporter, APA family